MVIITARNGEEKSKQRLKTSSKIGVRENEAPIQPQIGGKNVEKN